MDISFGFPQNQRLWYDQFVNFIFGSNLLFFWSSWLVCPSTCMDQQIAGFQISQVGENIPAPKSNLNFSLFMIFHLICLTTISIWGNHYIKRKGPFAPLLGISKDMFLQKRQWLQLCYIQSLKITLFLAWTLKMAWCLESTLKSQIDEWAYFRFTIWTMTVWPTNPLSD